ncbi:MAG: ribosome recycling factor [Planctomycetota bacterium]|jgi:ribosome recycling factor
MSGEETFHVAEKKMEKVLHALGEELKGIRTGRASTGLVDHVKVNYYDAATPLNQLATVSIPEPQTIVIKPYDPSVLKEVEKAILQSDLGLNPQNDGKCIRINLPPLSEERRKKLASQAKELSESTKISLRNIRREANKHIDKEEKASIITEDDAHKSRNKVQELTHTYEKKVSEIIERKSEEIMKV